MTTEEKHCGRWRIVIPVLIGNLVAANLAGHLWQPSKRIYVYTMCVAIFSFFATFAFDKGIGQLRELSSIGMSLLTFGLGGMVVAGFRYAAFPIGHTGVASFFFASSLGVVWTVLFWGLLLLRIRSNDTS